MKRKIILIGWGCLGLLLPCYGAKTSGHYVSHTLEKLPAFHALQVEGKVEVDFTQQASPAVHISGSEQMVAQALVRVKEGKLEIEFFPQGLLSSSNELRVTVAAPSLAEVIVSGESDVRLRGPLQGNRLELTITGEGVFSADGISVPLVFIHTDGQAEVDINRLEAQQIHAKALGRSDIELSGLALSAELENHGSGKIDAEDLRVQHGSATVYGKGDIEISAYEALSAAALGKGRIKYKGAPVSLQRSGYTQRIVPDRED